jgi:hypothetical protein
MATTKQTTDGIDPKEIHDILRNDRRRHTIKHLRRQLEPVSLRELSERVAEMESGESPAPRKLRESVYNSLHQTHLPKLDERRIIDYDRDRKTIELLEGASDVDIYMEVINRYGISWVAFYRTLGVVSLVVITAANASIPLVSAVPTLLWAVVFLVVFAVSTSLQLWSRRWFYMRSLLR